MELFHNNNDIKPISAAYRQYDKQL